MARRGASVALYEAMISILVLFLFAYAMLGYIRDNANGDAYFSKFYAADLASTAEVVAGGYGNVDLRYDNIKADNRLNVAFENGRVEVGNDQVAKADYFGKAERFDRTELTRPTFLVLRKIGARLGVADTDGRVECPAFEHGPVDKARVYIKGTPKMQEAFAATLKKTPITVVTVPAEATIVLEVVRAAGDESSVSFAPTNDEGAAYACNAAQQLSRLTLLPLNARMSAASAKTFTVTMTVTTKTDDVVTDEQVGKALALALAVHYR